MRVDEEDLLVGRFLLQNGVVEDASVRIERLIRALGVRDAEGRGDRFIPIRSFGDHRELGGLVVDLASLKSVFDGIALQTGITV